MSSDIKVGILLHFYQPWWQFKDVLTRIADECYRPILKWADKRPGFAFSANVNWSLLELLRRDGHDDVIELFARTARQGKIELFGTAAHHPILPLLTDAENRRQIEYDRQSKIGIGFPAATCGGFYLPEYAFSRAAARPIIEAGYTFTVADDACFGAQHGYVPTDHIPKVDGLLVFLRSRRWGNALSQGEYDFDRLNREFVGGVGRWFGGRPGCVVLATDAETFGHHHKRLFDWLLKPMVENWSKPGSPAEVSSFQSLCARFGPHSGEIAVPPSSWSTENHDFVKGDYFPLWKSPGNIYHEALWHLVELARKYGDAPEVESDVLKMLSSCCWWQVSGRPNFNPRLMMCGAKKAREVIECVGDEATKQQARLIYDDLSRLPGIGQ